jgi:hypothetical protein
MIATLQRTVCYLQRALAIWHPGLWILGYSADLEMLRDCPLLVVTREEAVGTWRDSRPGCRAGVSVAMCHEVR